MSEMESAIELLGKAADLLEQVSPADLADTPADAIAATITELEQSWSRIEACSYNLLAEVAIATEQANK